MTTVILCLLLLVPSSAAAAVIFDWTGTCLTGCTGQATFHVITTDAYQPGTHVDITGRPLIEATYHDNLVTLSGLAEKWNRGNGIDFLLPVLEAGPSHISMEAFGFRSDATGAWHLSAEISPGCVNCNCAPVVFCGYFPTGVDSAWARVPWPPGAVLLGLGLLLLHTHAQRVARARRRLYDHRVLAGLH